MKQTNKQKKKESKKERKKEKKCRNRHNLFLTAERACPDSSKLQTFILLVPLVFELELFKPKIGISFFGSETHITRPIAPKICPKNDSYVPQLRSKFQVSTFSRFKVRAFYIFVYEFVTFARKKHKNFRRKALRKSK